MGKFVLTAELQVRNQNLRPVISQLQKQLSNVKANVTLKLDPSTKGNLDNINKALTLMDSRLRSAAGAAVVLNQQISQLNKTLGGNLNKLGQITQTATKTQNAMNKTAKASNEAASGMTRLGRETSSAIKRIASFSVATSGVILLTTAMKSGIQEAILFQHGLVKISQITGTSVKNLGNLTSEITRLSTTLGVSSQELLNVSDTLAQAGLSADEVTIALEALAKTKLAPTFGKIEDTVEGVIASMRQFNIEAKDLEATLGSFNSVAAAFAVESNDIVTAVRRSGAAFEAAGGSLEEFIALFTSVRQTTRESAETIATGFRTIFTRIQRPKTLGFLRDLGVELVNLKGQFVGPYEAVRKLSEALAAIPSNDPRFAQIIEELGGFRQVSKVIPLIQQFAVAEKALAVAQRGRGSLTRDAVTAQQSLLVQLTKLRERFFELFRTIGDSSSLQGFLQLGLKLGDSLVTIGQALTPLIPLFTTLGAIKLGSGLKNFSVGFTGGKTATGAGKGTTAAATSATTNAVSAATSNNANAIGSNTAAITKLTAILQTLPSALSSRVSTGLGGYARSNGPVRKFARGGIVPGTGNLDNVDAKLMPGEFVMPKGSVEKIGADNLAQMARGGQVKKYANGGKVFGLAALYPETFKTGGTRPVGEFARDDSVNLSSINPLTQTTKERFGISNPKQYGYKLVAATISNKVKERFDETLYKDLQGAVANQAQTFLPLLSPGSSYKSQNLDKFGFKAMSGNIFEATLASVGPPYSKESNTQSFDFPSGLKNTAQALFNAPSLISNPTDAKRTYSGDTIADIDKKVLNYIAAENAKTLSPAQQKTLNTQRASKRPIRKADGGEIAASGTDSIQALLTPGEYVFDEPSAKRIGYGNLEKMRAQRYAKGGIVKRFGSGGKSATPTSTSTSESGGLGKFTPLLFVLPQLASQFGGLSDEIQKVATQFISIAAISTITGKSLGGFKESAEKVTQTKEDFEKHRDAYNKSVTTRQNALDDAGVKRGRAYRQHQQSDIELRKATGGANFGKLQQEVINEDAELQDLKKSGKNPRLLATLEERKQRVIDAKPAAQKFLVDKAAYDESKVVYNKKENAVNRLSRSLPTIQEKENLARKAKFEQNAGTAAGVLGGLGVAAGVVGEQFISKPANQRIDAGNGTQADAFQVGVGGAVSGAGSGAAMGAAFGSLLGPVGALAGAIGGGLIGGINGFVNASEEAAAKIKAIGIAKEFANFDRVLKRTSANTKLSIKDKSDVRAGLPTLKRNVLDTNQENRNEITAKAEGQLGGLEDVGTKLAASVTNIDEFRAASGGLGQELITTIALISKIPIAEVTANFEKSIKLQANQAVLNKKIEESLAQVYSDSRFITTTVRAFNDSATALQKFVNVANTITNDFQNIGFDTDMTDVLSKGLEANPADLNRVLTQLLGDSGQGVTDRLTKSAEASRQLPDILRNAAAAGPLSTGDPNDAFSGFTASINEATEGFPEEFKSIIQGNLANLLSGDSGDGKFLDKVHKDAEKFAKQLGEGAEDFIQSLNGAAEVAKKNADALIAIVQQRNSIEQKVTELTITAAGTRTRALRQGGLVGTNKFNSDVSGNEAQNSFNQSQDIRLKGTGLTSASGSSELSDAITAKRNKLLSLQSQRNGTGVNSKNFESLTTDIGKTENELQKLTAALSEQANSTEVLTALQNELSVAEGKRKATLGLVSGLAFGGREGRADFAKSAQNARAIAANPSKIGSAEQEGSAQKFLDQIIEIGAGDKQLGSLGGKSANQVKQERLGAFVGQDDAALLMNSSKPEIELQKKIVQVTENMAGAQERMADLEQAKLGTIDTTLKTGFQSMRAAFEASVSEAKATDSKNKSETAKSNLTTAKAKLTGYDAFANRTAALGGKTDETETVAASSTSILGYKKAIEDKKKLDSLTLSEDNVAGNNTGRFKATDANRAFFKNNIRDKLREQFGGEGGVLDDSQIEAQTNRISDNINTGSFMQGGGISAEGLNEEFNSAKEELKRMLIDDNTRTQNTSREKTEGISNIDTLLNLPKDELEAFLTSAQKFAKLDLSTINAEIAELQSKSEQASATYRSDAATAAVEKSRASELSASANKPVTSVAVPATARPVAPGVPVAPAVPARNVAVPPAAAVPIAPTSVASTSSFVKPAPLSNAEYAKLTPEQKAARKEQQKTGVVPPKPLSKVEANNARLKANEAKLNEFRQATKGKTPAEMKAIAKATSLNNSLDQENKQKADEKSRLAALSPEEQVIDAKKIRARDYRASAEKEKDPNEKRRLLAESQTLSVEADKQEKARQLTLNPRKAQLATTPSTLEGTFEERRAKQLKAIEDQKNAANTRVKSGQAALGHGNKTLEEARRSRELQESKAPSSDASSTSLGRPASLSNEQYAALTPEQKDARKQEQARYRATSGSGAPTSAVVSAPSTLAPNTKEVAAQARGNATPTETAALTSSKVLADTFSTANSNLVNTSKMYEAVFNKLPTEISFNGSFAPLQVNITGGEAFKTMEATLVASIMGQVNDQLAKVIPKYKTLVGPAAPKSDTPTV